MSPLPLGIVVTATGTGSEGNGGGVITNEKTKVKTGADRPATNARFAVIDPTLTYTVPQGQKISGAYDSLNHMMEEYFSLPVGDVLADDLLEAAMGSVVRNLPRVIADGQDYQAHANLAWASALAENRMLKCGKQTCFQLHMIEHQVGAFTDCVHGLGLAAIACAYYRHIFDASEQALFQFGRFATNVLGVSPEGKTAVQLAKAGIDALDAWTREVGAYRTLSELGVTEEMLDPIADSIVCLPRGLKVLDRDEVRAIVGAAAGLVACGCAQDTAEEEPVVERGTYTDAFTHSGMEYRGFELDDVLRSTSEGDIRFSLKVPKVMTGGGATDKLQTIPHILRPEDGHAVWWFTSEAYGFVVEYGRIRNELVPNSLVLPSPLLQCSLPRPL